MNCSGIRHVLETKFGGKFDSDIIIQDIYFISNTDKLDINTVNKTHL